MSKPKSRYFTFLLYPDSTPPDWRERLTDTGLPMAISPLHDRDRKEDTQGSGRTPEEIAAHRARIMADDARNIVEDYDAYYAQLYDKYLAEAQAQAADVYKKVHRHAIVAYPNTVTADAVRDRLKRVLGDHAVATVQIIAESVRNAYLYLTHESATAIRKKKYVYDKADIILINNFDVDRYTVIDAAEKKEILSKLTNLICDQLIENIIDLNLYLLSWLQPEAIWEKAVAQLAGCTILAAGIALEVRCGSVTMPGEGFPVAISKVTGIEFPKVKIVVDVSLVLLGIVFCYIFFGKWQWHIIGVGTLFAMYYVGWAVRIASHHLKWFDRLLKYRPGFRRYIYGLARYIYRK